MNNKGESEVTKHRKGYRRHLDKIDLMIDLPH